MKDDTYHLNQTPIDLCCELIKHIPLVKDDRVL